jgi:hypothetical protein
MNVTLHLRLVPGLRMSGAITPPPLYVFVTWTETTLLSVRAICLVLSAKHDAAVLTGLSVSPGPVCYITNIICSNYYKLISHARIIDVHSTRHKCRVVLGMYVTRFLLSRS